MDVSAIKQAGLTLLLFVLFFPPSNGERKMMQNFGSLKFMDLFLYGNMSIDVKAAQLHHGDKNYENITDAIQDIVEMVNQDGGWTIYGWGKKGFINDSSLVGNNSDDANTRVVAQEVTTRVIHIHQTNRQYLDVSTACGTNLENLKFKVLDLV